MNTEEIKSTLQPLSRHGLQQYEEDPLPSGTDEKVLDLVEAFDEASEEERREMIALASDDHSFGFFHFVVRMAALAVRKNDETYIRAGLSALIFEDLKFDARDSLCVLSTLYHSAEKIGSDPEKLFKDAAKKARPEVEDLLVGYLSRSPEMRDLMGYEESEKDGGFMYKSTL